MTQTVESTYLRASQQGVMTVEDDLPMINKTVQADHVAVRSMATRCAEAVHLVRRFRDGNPDLKLINHLNVGCILDCLKLLIETPLCFPRFMFQTLQTTSIKLVVSPQPRVAGEAITTTIGSQLAVKVEEMLLTSTGWVPALVEDEAIRQDMHAVSSLLKMYFRELPNPLCTYQLYDQFVNAVPLNLIISEWFECA
ncbi:hypothetical protein DAPPUDRAFT_335857, partial [Daphnia pulex]